MTNLIVNGFPKHGTHAAMKACELLGVNGIRAHWIHGKLPPHAKHVFIKRDPRDALISWVRMMKRQVTQGFIIASIRKFQDESIARELRRFVPFLRDGTFVLKYEALVADDRELRRLAEYLGVPFLSDAFENLPGFTATWNNKHSDHREYWTPEIEAVWLEEKGAQILEAWGYG